MKTRNYKLDILRAGNMNKDVICNENFIKIDNFLNSSIKCFSQTIPDDLDIGEKVILTSENNKNNILYNIGEGRRFDQIVPNPGMIVFVRSEKCFFVFDGIDWEPAAIRINGNSNMESEVISSELPLSDDSNTHSSPDEKITFTGIDGEYEIPEGCKIVYLYMNDNAKLNLDKVKSEIITLIIKQHYESAKNLEWPENILWQNKIPHKITDEPNGTDIIRLYKLPESSHFLGEVVGVNYQF